MDDEQPAHIRKWDDMHNGWCGQRIGGKEWAFWDLDKVLALKSRPVCPACLKAALAALGGRAAWLADATENTS